MVSGSERHKKNFGTLLICTLCKKITKISKGILRFQNIKYIIGTQQDVPYHSLSRARKSARAGWRTPQPSLISPRVPARASDGSGSA